MALREIVASFGFDIDTKGLSALSSKIESAKKGVSGFASQAVGAFVGLGLVQKISGIATEVQGLADHLTDTSAQVGTSAQALQAWEYRAKKAGIEGNAVAASLKKIQINASAAADGNQEARDAFKELGVSVKDGNGKIKDGSTLLEEVGLALQNVEPAKRMALAMKTLGKSGIDLLPVFAGGKEGLAEWDDEFRRFGGGLDNETIQSLNEAGDAMDRFEVASTSAKGKLAAALVPAFIKATDWIGKFASMLQRVDKDSIAFKSTIQAVATFLVGAFVTLYGAMLPSIIGFGLLFLIIQDIWVFLNDGDSLLGEFLDKAFGKGTKDTVLAKIRETLKDINKELRDADKDGGIVQRLLGKGAKKALGGEGLNSISNDFQQFFQTIGEQAEEAGREAVDRVVQVVSNPRPAIAFVASFVDGLLGNLPSRIVEAIWKPFISISEIVIQIGRTIAFAIVDGLTGGLLTRATAVKDAFLSILPKNLLGSGVESFISDKVGSLIGGSAGSITGNDSLLPNFTRALSAAPVADTNVTKSTEVNSTVHNNITVTTDSTDPLVIAQRIANVAGKAITDANTKAINAIEGAT